MVTDNHSYIAAFDLDKTILTINSSKLVVKSSRKTGLMGSREFWKAIYYSIVYKFDLKDANKIVAEMTRWLKGVRESDIVDVINKHTIPILLEKIRPEIREAISEHRKKRAKLVLLSSAMHYLCDPIAEHLGMDDIVCSSMETKDGLFTGKPEYKLVFGKEKAVRMKEYCLKNSFSIEDAWYYGDAYTDRFVLQEVGNPVCVKPEMKLQRMAAKNGWRIL